MLKPNSTMHMCNPTRWPWLAPLVVLLMLILPATALADPPEPGYAGPEKCAECHSAETEAWVNSPHAKAMAHIDESLQSVCDDPTAVEECTCLSCHTTDFNPADYTYAYGGVSCEACHGPYVEGHPQNGTMQLTVDSSTCRNCHQETHEQWEASPHAEAGVQCIGCHLSHSQDFRLTDEALCGACHRDRLEDFAHTAHETASVSCTDCHLSSVAGADGAELASASEFIGHDEPPSHSFTVVSSEACVACHGQTIHEVAPREELTQVANAQLLAMAERVPQLAAELEEQEQANKSLQVMTLVSLGLGLGIGGMLGIVFMLALGYIAQRRPK